MYTHANELRTRCYREITLWWPQSSISQWPPPTHTVSAILKYKMAATTQLWYSVPISEINYYCKLTICFQISCYYHRMHISSLFGRQSALIENDYTQEQLVRNSLISYMYSNYYHNHSNWHKALFSVIFPLNVFPCFHWLGVSCILNLNVSMADGHVPTTQRRVYLWHMDKCNASRHRQ